MVLIEYVGEAKSACWADGFIPERRFLEELYANAGHAASRECRLATASGWSEDELFCNILSWNATEVNRPEVRKQTHGLYIEDILYVKRPHHFRLADEFSPFYKELVAEQSPAYRQVITVYPSEWKEGFQETQRLLQSCGFGVRQEAGFRNYHSFSQAVEAVLKSVLLPYCAPGLMAEERLRWHGFETVGLVV